MKRKASFSWLYIPISILIFLAFALFVERSGISYDIKSRPIEFLAPLTTLEKESIALRDESNASTLVLSYSESSDLGKSYDTVSATLDNMKIPYHVQNVAITDSIDFSPYETVIISFVGTSKISNSIDSLMKFVENGGNLLFAIRPDNSALIQGLQSQLGIAFLDKGYIESDGIEFLEPLLPGSRGIKYGLEFMIHSSLPVDVAANSELIAVSADDQGIPLVWKTSYGKGTIIVINSDQFIDKGSRGLIGAAYSALQDVVIYPVINAVTFHIDDFPAPIPEGIDEDIFSQFTRDIKSFYLNVWWPDMQELKEKYNLVYTGFVIETYNYQIDPPFAYDINQEDLFQYFGGIVLRDGGEIGLHGYNHIPLCVESDGKNQTLDYPTWPSQENMQLAAKELHTFSSEMLGGQPFQAYVPPSNMLCDEARIWLPEVFTDLKVIASVYLPDNDVPAYVQEFEEAKDGIIEYPRITAGYDPGNYARWAQVNELWLHYAAGHFVHPDDVMDGYRSGGKTWLEMRETLDEYLLWLFSAMPNARNLTASEGGMALQRYARVYPEFDCDRRACNVELEGFYDEAWLMMRTEKKPVAISSGSFIEVTDNLYLIEANTDQFAIEFKEAR